jgi:septal ring factor EnvC (AmiA/AmiB activator)
VRLKTISAVEEENARLRERVAALEAELAESQAAGVRFRQERDDAQARLRETQAEIVVLSQVAERHQRLAEAVGAAL